MADMLREWVAGLLHAVEELGYAGIVIGLAIEIIPSEIVLAFGGYLVSKDGGGPGPFAVAVLCGTAGALVQQWILYAIGRYGGRPFLERFGGYLHLKPKHIDTAENWFNRYGAAIVFTGRFVPVMRQAVSIPAGMARMNVGLFTLLTLLASLPWSILFVWLGWTLGDRWRQIDEKAGAYAQPIVLIAVGLLIVYFIVQSQRKKGRTL